MIINVKDKKIKNKIEYINKFVKGLEDYLYKHADLQMWSIYNYNYCNHCAIGLAYALNKKIKDYEFEAYESHFTTSRFIMSERARIANKSITGREDTYNHAYVIGRNKKTGKYVLIDMQRTPIWDNMIKDISAYAYNKGEFIEGEHEVYRRKYDLVESLAIKDYLTNTIGKELFDAVMKSIEE